MSTRSTNYRAFAYDGVVYTVINPSPIQHIPGYPVIDPHLNLDGRDLRKPLRATNKCPELAYMVRRFKTENAFMARLHCDRDSLQVVKTSKGYMLSPTIAKSWLHLESSLLYVCEVLLNEAAGKPEAMFPFDPFWPNPSEYGYRDNHPTEHAARISALKARDACAVLTARCTMAIALLTSSTETSPPRWVVALMKANVPPAWIDEFRQSVVADLSPDLRAGTIIYPIDHRKYDAGTAWVNHVPCMIRANLPVYIAWPQDLSGVLAQYPFLRDYLPDLSSVPEVPVGPRGEIIMHPRPRLVGIETSFRWSDILPVVHASETPEHHAPPPKIPHGPGQRPGESCHEFFARRAAANRQREMVETPEGRTKRLLRQQKADTFKRPTRPTHVYLWKVVGEVDEQVPIEMLEKDFRAYVKPAAVGEIWGCYPNSHKRYDAWADEWDICPSLAPDDAVIDPWEELDEPDEGESHAAPFEAELRWFHHTEASESYAPVFAALGDVLTKRYGLVANYQPNAGIDYNAYPPDKVRMYIGYLEKHLPPDSIYYRPLAGLISSLLSNPAKPNAPGLIWDLNSSCDLYLLSSLRKHPSMEVTSLNLSGRRWYRVHYTSSADNGCWWELVVQDAASVLELYRQPIITDRLRAAEYLMMKGIPFQTIFLPDRRELVCLHRPSVAMSVWRPRGARYDRHDYLAYERRTRELLSQPRGRAAFLQGGIVWRLAVEILHGGLVTPGPSEDVYQYGQAFRPERGEDYLDDALSADELDMVCGVYKVFTDNSFKQTEDLSWWPKPKIWEKCSLNVGYWTPWCEEWFQGALKRYLAGDGQLKNSTGWKNALSKFRGAGKLRDTVELASEMFLRDRMRIPSARF